MPNKTDKIRTQFVAMHNSVPINVHTSDDLTSPLSKYYKKAFDLLELADKDKAIIAKKAADLERSGKCNIKGYTFLKIEPEETTKKKRE